MAKDDGFVYEPEDIVPDNLPPLPVGTLDEIKREGLDPAQVGCCHRRVVSGDGTVSIVGCKYRVPDGEGVAIICQREERDVSGPVRFGLKYSKGKAGGGAVLRVQHDCFWLAENKRAIEANGGVVKVIAWEPDQPDGTRKDGRPTTYTTTEFGPGPTLPPVYQERITEKTVKPFPRPGQNPDLAGEILKALERAEAEKERLDRRDEGFVA